MTDISREAYLIFKAGRGFYRPDSKGYTGQPFLAGRYTREEAESITHPNGADGPRDGMHFVHESKYADDEIIQQFDALLAKCEALEAKLSATSDMAERLKMEAMNHAQEARTQRSIVHECLQAATGATGEPGDWHGAEPVKARIAELEAKLAEANMQALSDGCEIDMLLEDKAARRLLEWADYMASEDDQRAISAEIDAPFQHFEDALRTIAEANGREGGE